MPITAYNGDMPAYSTLERIAEIAEEQWGLITRQQAENASIPARTFGRLTADDSVLRRVAHGVYQLNGTPEPDHLPLRAAWLQLAPAVPRWERTAAEGVISHRSAAELYGLGHLPADRHEFTVAERQRVRRPDVRIHTRKLDDTEWIMFRGLPVTRPSRIASDLLFDHADPGAVGQVIVDALRHVYDYPGTFAEALAPHAGRFGLRRGDGVALLKWLLDLVGDPATDDWMREARAAVDRGTKPAPTPTAASDGSQ